MWNRRNVFIFVLCLFIGFGIVLQERVSEGQMLYVSAKALSDYQTTIESEKKAIETTNLLIQEAEEELAQFENANGDDSGDFEDKLKNEMELYGTYIGAFDLWGPGVVITIDDGTRDLFEGEDINNLLVHDADILIVINDLKKSGAEAISVNGERLVDSSAVICSGYTVEINGVRYARPFVIRAIGDGKRMAASLIEPGGYGTSLKNWGVLFKIELLDEVFVPKADREQTMKYMKKVKEVTGV